MREIRFHVIADRYCPDGQGVFICAARDYKAIVGILNKHGIPISPEEPEWKYPDPIQFKFKDNE